MLTSIDFSCCLHFPVSRPFKDIKKCSVHQLFFKYCSCLPSSFIFFYFCYIFRQQFGFSFSYSQNVWNFRHFKKHKSSSTRLLVVLVCHPFFSVFSRYKPFLFLSDAANVFQIWSTLAGFEELAKRFLALGRLFSKIIFKSSNDFVYLWKLRKIKSAVKMRSECGFLVDQKVRWWTSAEVLKWTQLTSK